MKHTFKRISAIGAAAMMLQFGSMLGTTASAAETVRLMGDLNADLAVTADDAQVTLGIYVDALAGNISPVVTEENEAADINMNGVIELEDAANILSYYCQTLVGDQPLWADFRNVSYADGTDFYSREARDDNGEIIRDADGNPIKVTPRENNPFKLTGMYIEVGCAEGEAGETVSVPVYVAGLPKLAGFQIKVDHTLPLDLLKITSDLASQEGWNGGEVIENTDFDDHSGVFTAAQAGDIELKNGYILGNLVYQIPKDAKSGTTYTVSVDSSYTMFVRAEALEAYQYTMLSGVVRVK